MSELIVMAMQALLDDGDEVLVPSPDYPLWTAAVALAGGTPRHYLCDEQAGWLPDLDDIRAKIASRTRAIVLINPNNPTGAVYPVELLQEIVEIARQHQLIVYA
ncbi:MAG: aminotransferase class I/II-fold pyridoxal phosphate-dependent enzyme, partial [Halothiobacillaceae bacterium]